jgi:histidine triad (HIT) family protein
MPTKHSSIPSSTGFPSWSLVKQFDSSPTDTYPRYHRLERLIRVTIFQKIIDREIPADIVFEDEHCLAFTDIAPQAPTHILIIPKKRIRSAAQITQEDGQLIGHLWNVIRQVAEKQGLDNGYRVVTNCGEDGGQAVDHLHFHLLGGRPMEWPPG